jgi:hypothetical protein
MTRTTSLGVHNLERRKFCCLCKLIAEYWARGGNSFSASPIAGSRGQINPSQDNNGG